MLSSLLLALVVIAIICIVANIIIRLVPMAEPLPMIIWGVVAIICLIVLYQAVSGHRLTAFG